MPESCIVTVTRCKEGRATISLFREKDMLNHNDNTNDISNGHDIINRNSANKTSDDDDDVTKFRSPAVVRSC